MHGDAPVIRLYRYVLEEESPVHKYYPTPDSSVEMGLTQLSAVLAKENTKGSLSNTSVTDDELVGNTTFIHKVHTCRGFCAHSVM